MGCGCNRKKRSNSTKVTSKREKKPVVGSRKPKVRIKKIIRPRKRS